MRAATRLRSLLLPIAAVGAICVAPATAHGQLLYQIGIGSAVPIASTADLLNPGYNALLAITMKPGWMRHSLRFEGATNSMAAKAPATGRRQVLSATANVIISGAEATAPLGYVILGFGTYQSAGGLVRTNNPGINVGAGIRFSMGFFGTFAEARLHFVDDAKKTKYFPMTFGLTF
jgi:hypothetical protein